MFSPSYLTVPTHDTSGPHSHETYSAGHEIVPPGTPLCSTFPQSPPLNSSIPEFKPKEFQLDPNNELSQLAGQNKMIDLIKLLVLPVIAITYLSFCYIVHDRVIPVTKTGFIDISPQNIASVKSAITSISILIVSIGLWSLRSLIDDLKSEEFFRVLSSRQNGVSLATVNAISLPSFGGLAIAKAVSTRNSSLFFTMAVIGGFLSIAVSTLAPAALSVESVLFDTDMMAFKVGSVAHDSVYNVTDMIPYLTSQFSQNTELAASITWAETVLGVRYSFTQHSSSGKISPYIVPWPADLPYGTTARWLTDVAALHPACIWSRTNISDGLDYRAYNLSTVLLNQTSGIYLVDANIDVDYNPYFMSGTSPSIKMLGAEFYLQNHTNQAQISDGSVAWQVAQCILGCGSYTPDIKTIVKYNFTGIPTMQVIGADSTWEIAHLVCSPHFALETREARSDAQGVLSVYNNSGPYTAQGNFHPAQMGLLFTFSMLGFPDAGPSFGVGLMGSKAQASLIFGNAAINNVNVSVGEFTITPLPTQAIAESYIAVLQSITKNYMSGSLGTTYVPGRLSRQALIFRSSRAYVAVSTGLFAILVLMVIAAHFRRRKGEQFTLFRIAAALNRSEIPAEFARTKRGLEKLGPKQSEESLLYAMGKRVVVLEKDENGNSLHLR